MGGGGARPTERDERDQARCRGIRRGPRRPRGAGERPARAFVLQHTRGRHGRPTAAAVRADHPAIGGCSRAAAAVTPALGILEAFFTGTSGTGTSDRAAPRQGRVEQLPPRAASRILRAAGSPPALLGERSSARWCSTTSCRFQFARGATRELGRPSGYWPPANPPQSKPLVPSNTTRSQGAWGDKLSTRCRADPHAPAHSMCDVDKYPEDGGDTAVLCCRFALRLAEPVQRADDKTRASLPAVV